MKKSYNAMSFAALSLTSADEKKYRDWAVDNTSDAQSLINGFCSQGYKVSITWVVESNAFCVSVIGTEDCIANKRAILTSWSDDILEALSIAVYKHVVMCDSGDWPTQDNTQRWG